jgi:hypothetical protein
VAVEPVHHLVDVLGVVDGVRSDPPAERELPPGAFVGGERDDGHRGACLGDEVRGASALGEGDDDARADLVGDVGGGAGDGLGDGAVGGGEGAGLVAVERALLGLGDDARHHAAGEHGVLAAGGLAGEHDAVGAVVDGVGDVAGLGAGGSGRVDHRLEHLGGHDDRHLVAPGGLDHLLLDDGHALGGEFDAEVAASDHDAVGDLEDALEVIDGGGGLDLGDDGGGPPPGLADLADKLHVVGGLDEGEGHVIDALGEAKGEVGLVFLGDG